MLGFAVAVVGDAFAAGFFFFPELGAAGAAAERVFAVAGEFDDVVGEDVEEVARRVVDAVVAAEVAGVVVGDGVVGGGAGELALSDELLEILGVVDDLEVAAELLVLLADGVHAVGAGGDDELGSTSLRVATLVSASWR